MPAVRRPLLLTLATVTVLRPGPAVAAPVPVVVIEGRGHGHGVGMAQDGAYWMGRSGATTAQILNQFYPGTTLGRAGGEVRVGVLTAGGPTAVIGFPGGGEIRDGRDGGQSAGFPVRVGAGAEVRLRFDGRQYSAEVVRGGRLAAGAPAEGGRSGAAAARASPGSGSAGFAAAQQSTTTTMPGVLAPEPPLLPLPSTPLAPVPEVTTPPTTIAPPTAAPSAPPAPVRSVSSRSLWAVPAGGGTVSVPERAHRYRGVVQVTGGNPLRLVNHIDVEQYLRGMGEVRNPSWPPASLRAQAIAARTYALRAVAGGGELCDSQQCQVYLGAEAEYAAMDKAVTATRGQVLHFRRALASAVYSANGGGFSASTEEGFGTPGGAYPYLRPARYPTKDPAPWSVTVAARDLAARLGYRGKVSAVRTQAAGPSGRVLRVTIEGSGGSRTVAGIDFDRALGLKSTMFSLKLGEAATPPPPPPPADGDAAQLLPGQAPAGPDGAPPGADAAAGAGSASPASAGIALAGAASDRPVALAALAWLLLAGIAAGVVAMRLGGRQPRVAATIHSPD